MRVQYAPIQEMEEYSSMLTRVKLALAGALLLLPLASNALAPQPAIVTRAEWGARAPSCAISQCTAWEHTTVHHTAAQTDFTVADHTYCDDRVRAHQAYHMDTNAWCDIGYNFLFCKHGYIFEGREGSITSYARGAHDSINCPGLGCSLMGYFHTPYDQQPTTEMMNALADLIAWQWDALSRNPYGTGSYGGVVDAIIGGHRDVAATACPGDIVYNQYIGPDPNTGWLRQQVCARMSTCGGPPPPPPAAPSALAATVVSKSQINLSWSDNSTDESSFVVERKLGSAGTYGVIATLAANTTAYANTGLSGGKTYFYRVKATNAGGSSAYSNEVSATTPKK